MDIENNFDINVYHVLKDIDEQLKYSETGNTIFLTTPYFINNQQANSTGYKTTRIVTELEKHKYIQVLKSFDYTIGEEETTSAGIQYELKVNKARFNKLFGKYKDHFDRAKLYLTKNKDKLIVKFIKPSGEILEHGFKLNSNYHKLIQFLAVNQGEKFKYSHFKMVLNQQPPEIAEGSSITNRVNSTIKDICKALKLDIDELFIRDNGAGLKNDFDIIFPSK